MTKALQILEKYNFNFPKKFGQNFLIDTHVLEGIIEGAEITKDDCVLEIGPGIGTMTQRLCEAAGKVVAVEIDDKLIPLLTEQFFVPNFDPKHIALADEADLFILAPATANTISKIANAQADNLLTSVACAWSKPMLLAPAMNFGMWFNPSNQNNIISMILSKVQFPKSFFSVNPFITI